VRSYSHHGTTGSRSTRAQLAATALGPRRLLLRPQASLHRPQALDLQHTRGCHPVVPATGLSPEADMERRLRALKDLHDQGLISDEAYKAKVEEILSIL
jgi:hypothetical protein